ncbi:MAG: hypothetical protein ACK4SA_17955, partial [Caldilinea sp.]
PGLGHFLSPDTIVPEAGNALDYHRYAYVRFNPLKYEDGSGHCATLANSQADENDAECWRLARTIANLWNDTDYWRTRFGELDVWNNHIAPSAVTAEFMQDEFDTYLQSDAYKTWAAVHPIGNSIASSPIDWGDYTSGSISFGPFQFAVIVDDYGNGYVQGGIGAIGLGASVNRGDIVATVGSQTSDIDYFPLLEADKGRLAQSTLVGPGVSASAGFLFLSIGGNANLPLGQGGSFEGGLNTSRGLSFSLQTSYTVQLYPELRFK